MSLNFTLRAYQNEAVDALRAAYRERCRAPLYSLPTGGGKTMVFSYVTANAIARGQRVLILVHRAELLRQASDSLNRWGVPHGTIVAGARGLTGHHVQVGSVQTVVRRLDRIAAPNLIIVDEAHHAVAGTWQKIINAFPDAKLLGVTATPERLDGRGLGVHCGGYFDRLIQGPTMASLIEDGYLVRPRVFSASVPPDLSEARTVAGDFNRADSERAVIDSRIVGDAVGHYRRICPGVPSIAFCVSLAHAEVVARQFNAAGFKAEQIDGRMNDHDRARVVSALGTGGINVMVSVDLVSEGFDVPVCGAALMLRPTQSMGLYLQQIGRALRPAPDKTCAFILDHAENTVRHGLPQDEREWTLDGRARRERDPSVKVCQHCFAVARAGASVCPECGAPFRVERREREVEQVAGELIELTPEMIAARKAERARVIAGAVTYDELREVARRYGYKPGWVHFILQARRNARQGAA